MLPRIKHIYIHTHIYIYTHFKVSKSALNNFRLKILLVLVYTFLLYARFKFSILKITNMFAFHVHNYVPIDVKKKYEACHRINTIITYKQKT